MSKPSDFTEVLSEDLLRQTAYCEVGSVEDSSILENCVETFNNPTCLSEVFMSDKMFVRSIFWWNHIHEGNV